MTIPQEQWVEIRSDQRNEMLFQPFIIITVIIIIIVVAVVIGSSFLENVLSSSKNTKNFFKNNKSKWNDKDTEEEKQKKLTFIRQRYSAAVFVLVVALLILITNVGWLADWTCLVYCCQYCFCFYCCSWLFQYSRGLRHRLKNIKNKSSLWSSRYVVALEEGVQEIPKNDNNVFKINNISLKKTRRRVPKDDSR